MAVDKITQENGLTDDFFEHPSYGSIIDIVTSSGEDGRTKTLNPSELKGE